MGLILYHICGKCNGSGVTPVTSGGGSGPGGGVTCPDCEGSGELYWGHSDALDAKFDNIDAKFDALDTKLDVIEAKIDAS
jgi:hypothetical protein